MTSFEFADLHPQRLDHLPFYPSVCFFYEEIQCFDVCNGDEVTNACDAEVKATSSVR